MPHHGVNPLQETSMGHPVDVDHPMIDLLLKSAEDFGRGVVTVEPLEACRVEEADPLISEMATVFGMGEDFVRGRERLPP